MKDTVFSKIIRGEIPCHKIYEDSQVISFLDAGPLSPGHALLIPKEQAVFLHELSDEAAVAIGRMLPRICRAVLRVTGATAYNVLQNNGICTPSRDACALSDGPENSPRTRGSALLELNLPRPGRRNWLANAIAKELTA